MKMTNEDRFWSKVDEHGPDECWPWKAGVNGSGYGQFYDSSTRRIVTAHRFAWEDAYGEVPEGYNILHACNNPICCNPNHLFLGTQRDNMLHRTDTSVHYRENHLGSKHHWAKLTEEIVREARAAFARRETITSQAKKYGVEVSAMSNAIHGKTWRHVK